VDVGGVNDQDIALTTVQNNVTAVVEKRAASKVVVVSGSTGKVTDITVNGTSTMQTAVTWTGSTASMAIAIAAQRVIVDRVPVMVAGGIESISCVQQELNQHMFQDPWLVEHKPAIYMSMLETAENVATRYRISRERQDEYGARSQQRNDQQ